MEQRSRNSQKSKEDILRAAEAQFSEKGIYGTRVDEIAKEASINKRMIYEYYGSKEGLYKAVLERSYKKLMDMELEVLSKNTPAALAVSGIVRLYFEFLSQNPSYVNLIMWENLNKGRYIRELDFHQIKHPAFDMMKKIFKKGIQDKVFRDDLDEDQLIISLLTFTFSYFSNKYTLSSMLGIRFDDEENIQKRIGYITDMFLKFICV